MSQVRSKEKQNSRPEWLSTGKAARITGTCNSSIRTWIKYLPPNYVKRTPGNHYRIHRNGLDFMLRLNSYLKPLEKEEKADFDVAMAHVFPEKLDD